MHEAKEMRKKILRSAYIKGIRNKKDTLASRLDLNSQTVEYVLEKMKQEQYFNKTKFDINLDTLGVGQVAWVLIGINWDIYDQEKLIKKLLELTPVLSISDVTGGSDLAIKIFGPSIAYLSSFVLGMEKLFQGIITHTEIYFVNREYKRHYLPVEKNSIEKINKIDCILIKEKTENPNITLIEIADKHKIHRNSVSKRWKLLWSRNIFVKEIPDLTQKGYDEIEMGLKAFMIIKPRPGCEDKIIQTLMKQKSIQDIFTTISNEIIIVLRTANSQTLAEEHRALTRVECSVRRTNTSIFLTKYNKTTLSLKEMNSVIGQCK